MNIKHKKHSQIEVDMTRGNLFKQILVFSLPLVAANLLQILFNISDIIVVGRFAGAAALGSVGSVSQMVALVVDFVLGMGTAVNVLVARYFGGGNENDVKETIHTSFLVLLSGGLIICIGGILITPSLLQLMGTKAELIDGAILYFRIYLLGIPALAIFDWGNAILGAIGDTKRPLAYLGLAGIINIILNLILVIGFHLDVAGVAIASCVSTWISAVLILIPLLKANTCYGFRIKYIRFYPSKTLQIFFMSYANGFQYAIFQIANMVIQSGVNTFDAVTVEGISAATNADVIVYTIMAAFYTGCSSFIGQNYGGGKKKRILHSYFIAMSYAFIFALLIGLFLFFFPRTFLGLFTTESEVIDAGVTRLRIMALSYCVSSFMDCTIAASRGLGRTIGPTILVILGSCVFRVVWVYTIFAKYQTVNSLFLLYVCSWTITAIVEIIYFLIAYHRDTKKMVSE